MPTQAPAPAKSLDFTTVRNHHEQAVFRCVIETAPQFPGVAHKPELMLDVACVALNRLPPRYIRFEADFAFFLSERERADSELAVSEAVEFAFGFIQARTAMRARR
jgi:Late competence development protein ComFB